MKSLKFKLWHGYLFLLACLSPAAYADKAPIAPSLGEMANNVMEPVSVFTNVMYTLCYIIGATLCVGGLIQYKEHRVNPVHVPINRPIVMLVLGLSLIAIPFIVHLSESASLTA